MSASPVSSLSGLGNVQSLAKSLIEQYDSNQDGQFSADEFSDFLSSFLQTITGQVSSNSSSTGTTSTVGTTSLLSTTSDTTTTDTTSTTTAACMPGWDQTKWADSSHTSIKYVAGRIMGQYKPSDWLNETTRNEIVEKFKAAGLNPKIDGDDCVDFNDGIGSVDIVVGASEGGKAWQWQPVKE